MTPTPRLRPHSLSSPSPAGEREQVGARDLHPACIADLSIPSPPRGEGQGEGVVTPRRRPSRGRTPSLGSKTPSPQPSPRGGEGGGWCSCPAFGLQIHHLSIPPPHRGEGAGAARVSCIHPAFSRVTVSD